MFEANAFSLAELAAALELDFRGDAATRLVGIAPLATASIAHLSFISNSKFKAALQNSSAGAVILHPELASDYTGNCLITADPYLAYARASALFDPMEKPRAGVHPSAVVVAVDVDESVSVGANCVIEQGAVIGAGTVLGPGTVIGANSKIGENCYIHANVSIYHGVSIGNEVVIHSGVVIGGDGFGFAASPTGWQKIHQLGGVRIGDRVEIGANSCVDRGALDDTVLGDNVICDDYTMIAHNVIVGDGTAMAAGCQIAGSAVIGKHCTLAGNVGVVGHITIADHVHVTARGMITKSILEPGSYSSGTGMMETAVWRKNAARFTKLDELFRRVGFLEKKFKTNKG
ncbi:UDP-3-O-(3-hydroxymyristoyl)glucosamine N-acyltransferase [Zhongshania sp.]|uniref:UDP-3-O-(3-hydroxymyristoyl)glucosamine N-acyltransferase n=1 Tax=Zhongshania sp. TaxID=1971902 RepID=UPI00356A744B